MTGHYKGCEEWYGRGCKKYDPAIHFPLLHEIFDNCHGVVAFCSASKISTKTFHNWCNLYPEFQEEYHIALAVGAAKWEFLPLQLAISQQGQALNHNYWMSVNRNRYRQCHKYLNKYIEPAKEDSTMSRMEAAWDSLLDGGITPQEFSQVASGLSTESRIKEVDLQKEVIDNMKESTAASKEITDEALKAFMLVKSGKGRVVLTEQVEEASQ